MESTAPSAICDLSITASQWNTRDAWRNGLVKWDLTYRGSVVLGFSRGCS